MVQLEEPVRALDDLHAGPHVGGLHGDVGDAVDLDAWRDLHDERRLARDGQESLGDRAEVRERAIRRQVAAAGGADALAVIQRVLVSQLDEPLAIAGVKHQEAGQTAALLAVHPQYPQQAAQLGWQLGQVIEGYEVEILAWPDDTGLHLAQLQSVALPRRD